MRIREIAQARVRYGYRKIRVLLNREGWDVGKYLVYRLYKEEGLMLKRMKPAGKRKASRQREEKLKATAPDQAWSMDFVSDQLQDGTRFRSLTIVDVYMLSRICCENGFTADASLSSVTFRIIWRSISELFDVVVTVTTRGPTRNLRTLAKI